MIAASFVMYLSNWAFKKFYLQFFLTCLWWWMLSVDVLIPADPSRCFPGRGELCSAAAGRRPHRLPTQRPCCTWARGPQHHGNHRQQARGTHHQRDTPDLWCGFRVHPKHDQQGKAQWWTQLVWADHHFNYSIRTGAHSLVYCMICGYCYLKVLQTVIFVFLLLIG